MDKVKIKICGLSRREDIAAANACLPDYIGFVFAESKRLVSTEWAAALKAALDERVKAVGVFVNEDINAIADICRRGIIELVQLHGDEDGAYIAELRKKTGFPVIKAVAVGRGELLCPNNADYVLFDTYRPGTRGGTGEAFDWEVVRRFGKPFFLAGGLNAGNVERAIWTVNPYCVDISGGVETDGRKDAVRMLELINKVREVRI